MQSEFHQWLTANYPTKKSLSIWDSHEIGCSLGHFSPTTIPLRSLAPAAYECGAYGEKPVLDSAGVILTILSQLPNSTALISTFWQSLMFGDLGLYSDHNRLPNDLDVAIASTHCHSSIFCSILRTSEHLVEQREKFPPYDMFSTSISQSHWPEIPPTVQVNYTLPYRHGELVPHRPMLEIHPLTSDQDHIQTLETFLRCYAPFYIRSQGLTVVAVSAQNSNGFGHYYIGEYPPGYTVSETIVKVLPRDLDNHSLSLTAHHEPTPRLGMILPRIALAAVIGGAGKQKPMEINAETIRLIKESLGLLSVSEKRRVDEKVRRTTTKVDLVQHHLDRAANELKPHAYRNMRAPRIPFPKSESPLRDAFEDYLRILGYCYP